MSFDIYGHILDHINYSIDNLAKKDKKLVHFNTSIDLSYFIFNGYDTQKSIDVIMKTILIEVSKKTLSVNEKNGIYINKLGIKKQKFRIRKITFDNILMAYHSRHYDFSKSVHPHFHFLLNEDSRVGKHFIYLKKALEEQAKIYNIKFNFMEEKQITGLTQSQQKALESMS